MEYVKGKELWEMCNIYGINNRKKVYYYFYEILKAF